MMTGHGSGEKMTGKKRVRRIHEQWWTTCHWFRNRLREYRPKCCEEHGHIFTMKTIRDVKSRRSKEAQAIISQERYVCVCACAFCASVCSQTIWSKNGHNATHSITPGSDWQEKSINRLSGLLIRDETIGSFVARNTAQWEQTAYNNITSLQMSLEYLKYYVSNSKSK